MHCGSRLCNGNSKIYLILYCFKLVRHSMKWLRFVYDFCFLHWLRTLVRYQDRFGCYSKLNCITYVSRSANPQMLRTKILLKSNPKASNLIVLSKPFSNMSKAKPSRMKLKNWLFNGKVFHVIYGIEITVKVFVILCLRFVGCSTIKWIHSVNWIEWIQYSGMLFIWMLLTLFYCCWWLFTKIQKRMLNVAK